MTNETMVQFFEWYLPADQKHWHRCWEQVEELKKLGVTKVWLPPAYKGASGANDVGYGVYDTYDLGEFDQKGTVATKYGTRQEYLDAVRALQGAGMEVFADIVLNHRMGADEMELVCAAEDAPENRELQIANEKCIGAWTKFTFPGRKGKYSEFTWNWRHFKGIDYDGIRKENGIFRFRDKVWDDETDTENANYDYLMGADVDFSVPEVLEELGRWGEWYYDTVQMDGFRLDAVKHIHFDLFEYWLKHLRETMGRNFPAVGEYWSGEEEKLLDYLDACDESMSLFDVPLHYHFLEASTCNGQYDLRRIFDGTLVKDRPYRAYTFVDNHDTQPGQALASWIPAWFKPLAYAMILLRDKGIPCVFYGDLYSIPHDEIAPVAQLPVLMNARKERAYGAQHEYFDHPNIIGWTREGDEEHEDSGLAVLLSDGPGGEKRMYVGAQHAGEVFVDLLGVCSEQVVIDAEGCGVFRTEGGAVAVWGKV